MPLIVTSLRHAINTVIFNLVSPALIVIDCMQLHLAIIVLVTVIGFSSNYFIVIVPWNHVIVIIYTQLQTILVTQSESHLLPLDI